MNILLADDDPRSQEALKLMTDSWGYHLDIANNGKEAYEKAEHKRYDICLMDINMPGMNGFETARLIRRLPWVPILAFTADELIDTGLQCFEAGMDGYVEKPCDMGKLKEDCKLKCDREKTKKAP